MSLTNGPSMILGRLGEPASPVDPYAAPLARVDSRCRTAAECPTIPATPCVPPCVAMCPQTREMSRGAPGRLYCSPASPDRALPPSWPCFSAEKTTGHPASKTLGTATIPDQRSLPASARFADEHPIQSGALRSATKPNTMRTHGIPSSRPCRAEEEATVPRGPLAASSTQRAQLQIRCLDLDLQPRARPDGLAARFPRQYSTWDCGRRMRAPCRSTSSELMCHAIPVSLTVEPKLSRW